MAKLEGGEAAAARKVPLSILRVLVEKSISERHAQPLKGRAGYAENSRQARSRLTPTAPPVLFPPNPIRLLELGAQFAEQRKGLHEGSPQKILAVVPHRSRILRQYRVFHKRQ